MTTDRDKLGRQQGDFTGGEHEGTISLCCTCHSAIIVKRYKGGEVLGGKLHTWNYLAWTHFSRHYAGSHDPKPANCTHQRRR